MKENTIMRIKQFIDYKGIPVSTFERSVGMSNGSFASQLKNNKTIGVDKLENILKKFPEINIEWLLTGKGQMLKKEIEYEEKSSKLSELYEDNRMLLKKRIKDLEEISRLKDRLLKIEEEQNAIKSTTPKSQRKTTPELAKK